MASHEPKMKFSAFPQFKKGTHETVDRSMMDVQHAGKSTRNATNLIWSKATGCSLFRKTIAARVNSKTGKTKALRVNALGQLIDKRPNRAFGGHAFKSLASGAAAAVGAELEAHSKQLRCNTRGEYELYPMLPAVTPGAALQMEVAATAYAQEIVHAAISVMKCGSASKITPRCAQAACDIVNKKLNSGSGFMPSMVMASFSKPKPKKSSSKKAAAEVATK